MDGRLSHARHDPVARSWIWRRWARRGSDPGGHSAPAMGSPDAQLLRIDAAVREAAVLHPGLVVGQRVACSCHQPESSGTLSNYAAPITQRSRKPARSSAAGSTDQRTATFIERPDGVPCPTVGQGVRSAIRYCDGRALRPVATGSGQQEQPRRECRVGGKAARWVSHRQSRYVGMGSSRGQSSSALAGSGRFGARAWMTSGTPSSSSDPQAAAPARPALGSRNPTHPPVDRELAPRAPKQRRGTARTARLGAGPGARQESAGPNLRSASATSYPSVWARRGA